LRIWSRQTLAHLIEFSLTAEKFSQQVRKRNREIFATDAQALLDRPLLLPEAAMVSYCVERDALG